jgi:type I restriction enzyme, S subunit
MSGQLVEQWTESTLGELFEIVTGTTPSKSKTEFYGDYMPFIKPPELLGGLVEESADGLSELGSNQARVLPPESVLVSCIGKLGKLGMNSSPVAFNQQINAIKPNYEIANPKFVFYYCMSNQFRDQLHGLASGTTVFMVNKTKFKGIKISLPSLNEQQRIVSVLDEAFKEVENRTSQIKMKLHNGKELFQSVAGNLFSTKGDSWKEEAIGKMCEILNGFAFKSKDTINQSTVQLVRMGNLYQNQLNLNRTPVFYPEHFSIEFDKYLLTEGDIIMSLTGTVGKEDYGFAIRIPKTKRKLLLNQRIAKFHSFHESLDADYFLNFLKSKVFLDELYLTANGTRQANLSTKKIKELTISYPSIIEQKTIVEKLDTLSNNVIQLEQNYRIELESLTEFKQSILQEAFNGTLRIAEGLADQS